MEKSTLTVCIKGDEYRLDQFPDSQSKLVQECRNEMFQAIVLTDFMQDLAQIGNYIRIAYNGVAAVDNCTEIQIKVQRIAYNTSDLCDSLATTFGNFSSGSRKILEDLSHCYENLLNGCEDIATSILHNCAKKAKDLSKESMELRDELRNLAKDVIQVLEDTERARGDELKHFESLTSQLRDMEKRGQEGDEACKKMKMADETSSSNLNIRTLVRSAFSAMAKAKRFIRPAVKQGFETFCPLGISDVILDAFDEFCSVNEKADHFDKEKRIKYLDAMQKQCDNRIQVLQQVRDLAKSIRDTKGDLELSDGTIALLHLAVGELKKLSVIMKSTAEFWNQMRYQCEQMDVNEIVSKRVETHGDKDLKTRWDFWQSNYFKHKAVSEFAKWVALKDICEEGARQIKITQQDLHDFLRENLTNEEGRRKAREWAGNLADDVDKVCKHLEIEYQARESEYQQLIQCNSTVASLA